MSFQESEYVVVKEKSKEFFELISWNSFMTFVLQLNYKMKILT